MTLFLHYGYVIVLSFIFREIFGFVFQSQKKIPIQKYITKRILFQEWNNFRIPLQKSDILLFMLSW